jgi:hypothetical protein
LILLRIYSRERRGDFKDMPRGRSNFPPIRSVTLLSVHAFMAPVSALAQVLSAKMNGES